jgi:hypothetical protein
MIYFTSYDFDKAMDKQMADNIAANSAWHKYLERCREERLRSEELIDKWT